MEQERARRRERVARVARVALPRGQVLAGDVDPRRPEVRLDVRLDMAQEEVDLRHLRRRQPSGSGRRKDVPREGDALLDAAAYEDGLPQHGVAGAGRRGAPVHGALPRVEAPERVPERLRRGHARQPPQRGGPAAAARGASLAVPARAALRRRAARARRARPQRVQPPEPDRHVVVRRVPSGREERDLRDLRQLPPRDEAEVRSGPRHRLLRGAAPGLGGGLLAAADRCLRVRLAAGQQGGRGAAHRQVPPLPDAPRRREFPAGEQVRARRRHAASPEDDPLPRPRPARGGLRAGEREALRVPRRDARPGRGAAVPALRADAVRRTRT